MIIYVIFLAPFGALASGGPDVMISASAGFIYGFMLAAAAVGYFAERGWDRSWFKIIISMLIGEVIMYICGLIFLPFGIALTNHISAHDAVCGYGRGCVGNTLWYGMVPYLPGDAIKIVLVCLVLPIGWKVLGYRASHKKVDDQLRQRQRQQQVNDNDNNINNTSAYQYNEPQQRNNNNVIYDIYDDNNLDNKEYSKV